MMCVYLDMSEIHEIKGSVVSFLPEIELRALFSPIIVTFSERK